MGCAASFPAQPAADSQAPRILAPLWSDDSDHYSRSLVVPKYTADYAATTFTVTLGSGGHMIVECDGRSAGNTILTSAGLPVAFCKRVEHLCYQVFRVGQPVYPTQLVAKNFEGKDLYLYATITGRDRTSYVRLINQSKTGGLPLWVVRHRNTACCDLFNNSGKEQIGQWTAKNGCKHVKLTSNLEDIALLVCVVVASELLEKEMVMVEATGVALSGA